MKPHRTDVVSLTFGLIFLAMVGLWMARRVLDFVVPQPALLFAGGLILFGILGLVGSVRAGRHAPREAERPVPEDRTNTS